MVSFCGTNVPLKRRHRCTLASLFEHPIPANIPWRDIQPLFIELGAEVSERQGSRVGVRLFGDRRVFHRPHPSPDTDKGACSEHPRLAEAQRSGTMRNTMEIEGYRAIIQFDPDIDLFRGEFVGLNGGADFHAPDVAGLRREGAASLKVFLDMCREDGVEPRRQFSGKFHLRVPPELHAAIVEAAAADGKSLNQWVTDELSASVTGAA